MKADHPIIDSMAQSEQVRRLKIDWPEGPEKVPHKSYGKAGLISGAVLLLIVIGTFAWRRLAAPAVIEVETVPATAEVNDVSGMVLSASGYVVAHHRIDVNSKVTGRVAWIGVEKGDHVKQGQILVRLEDDEFKAQVKQAEGEIIKARARLNALLAGSRSEEIQRDLNSLQEAEATLANDKALLARNEALYAQGLISTQQVEESRSRYAASQHRAAALRQTYEMSARGPRKEDIEQARGDLEQAQGTLALSMSQLDATKIRAPVEGTILERTAEKGELITAQFATAVDSGGPRGSVVALADLKDLQVQVDVSQDDFARLTNVKRAEVTTDAYPDHRYEAVIAQVSPEANRQKATVEIRVQILHPDQLLRPEMNANVNFIAEEKSGPGISAIEVPFGAVITRNGARMVLLQADNKVVERPVHLIGKKTTGYLIQGINAGDRVVVDPPTNLKSGDQVRSKSH